MLIAMILGLLGGFILGFTLNISYPTGGILVLYHHGLLAAISTPFLGAARSPFGGEIQQPDFFFRLSPSRDSGGPPLPISGDRLGVPLYYAAILVFGGRLFQNLAVIRRLVIDKYIIKKDSNINKK